MKVVCLAVVLSIVTVWAAPSFDVKENELELANKILELLEEKKTVENARSMDVYAHGRPASLKSADETKRESAANLELVEKKKTAEKYRSMDVYAHGRPASLQSAGETKRESAANLLLQLLERAFVVPCGTTDFTASEGDFKAPGVGSMYYSNANCEWHITVPTDKVVKLHFVSYFQIDGQQSMGCQTDAVIVYDGDTTDQDKGVGRFCGKNAPDDLTMKTNKMTVQFVSDNKMQDIGFFAHFSAVDPL